MQVNPKYPFAGHALGIWICGCSLFYKRELWASKSAGAHSTKSLKISGCKRWCPKDLRVRAPAAPVLTHSLWFSFLIYLIHPIPLHCKESTAYNRTVSPLLLLLSFGTFDFFLTGLCWKQVYSAHWAFYYIMVHKKSKNLDRHKIFWDL